MGHTQTGADDGRPTRTERILAVAGALLAAAALIVASFAAHVALRLWPGAAVLVTGIGGILLAAIVPLRSARRARTQVERHAETAAAAATALAASDARAAAFEARGDESDALLDASASELFVIDPAYRIVRHVCGTVPIVAERNVAGRTILDVLAAHLRAPDAEVVRARLARYFDRTTSERSLGEAGPPEALEYDGVRAQPRHVTIGLRRVFAGGEIAHVIVVLGDVTAQVVASRALAAQRSGNDALHAVSGELLAIDGLDFPEFLADADAQLQRAAQTLAAIEGPRAGAALERIDDAMRAIDLVGEQAKAQRATAFGARLATATARLYAVYRGGDVERELVAAVVGELGVLRDDLAFVAALRLDVERKRRERLDAADADELVADVRDLAASYGRRFGKVVAVDVDGFDSRTLAPALRLAVKDTLSALTRNSVAHGIESTAERAAANKPHAGTIVLRGTPAQDDGPRTFAFEFRDDGRGLDAVRIRDRAVALGFLSVDEARAESDSDVARFIFEPGFTTAAPDAPEAGRGLGMSLVRTRIVDDCGGEIDVECEPGEYCAFTFALPLEEAVAATVLA